MISGIHQGPRQIPNARPVQTSLKAKAMARRTPVKPLQARQTGPIHKTNSASAYSVKSY